MNIKQVRILEACYQFLIDITNFKEEFQDDNLVYRYKGEHITFETYQEYERLSFVDYNLKHGYVDDTRTYLDDRADLIASFPSKEHLRALQRVTDVEHARIQVLKLLSQVNLDTLSEKKQDIKKDNFGYDFYNYATKEEYPIYLFEDDATFELVAIG
ncbi:hypothetical protein [Streptococcus sp. S784/96/1]|uniref:hypothetical protein n=1 Tax=Streptococcus sp. S784/96/1 TaxID=2653499 RepID=UPI0013876645|nr:hypothetical protein [Streptococcus sp. S784/96/1]